MENLDDAILVLLKAVTELPTDAIESSIKFIVDKCRNVSYDNKAKWLVFGGDPKLITAVAAKLKRDHRKRHGTMGRKLDLHVIRDGENGLCLFVHADFKY